MSLSRRPLAAVARLTLVFAVLGAVAAVAAPPVVRQGNLDSDPQAEDVRAVDLHPERPPPGARWQVRISDECPEGTVSRAVSGVRADVDQLRVVAADTRRGGEVFFELDGGGRGASDEYGLIAWREFASAPCRRPRALFRYVPERDRPAPRGAGLKVSAVVRLNDYAPRIAGTEVALTERYMSGDDAVCCPSIVRRTYFGYHAGRDRYVAFRAVVRDRNGRRGGNRRAVVCARAGAAC